MENTRELPFAVEFVEMVRRVAGAVPADEPRKETQDGLGCECGRLFQLRRHCAMHRQECLGGGGERYLRARGLLTRREGKHGDGSLRLTQAAALCIGAVTPQRGLAAAIRKARCGHGGIQKVVLRRDRRVCGADVRMVADTLAAGTMRLAVTRARPLRPRPTYRRRLHCTAFSELWSGKLPGRRAASRRLPLEAVVRGTTHCGAELAVRPLRAARWWKHAPDLRNGSWES